MTVRRELDGLLGAAMLQCTGNVNSAYDVAYVTCGRTTELLRMLSHSLTRWKRRGGLGV